MLYLILKKLSEILKIYPGLFTVSHRNPARHFNIHITPHSLYRPDNIRQLSNAGRLNENPVRMVLLNHLAERLTKISHKSTADASGIHLRNLNPCILQKTSVNTNLSKFIFNQHQLLPGKNLFKKQLNKRSLPRPEKARNNIYLCHS